MEKRPFIFVDEAGNFDFSRTGTSHYIFSCVTATAPFPIHAELDALRFRLMHERNVKVFFHAAEDEQYVRDEVYSIICPHLQDLTIDTVIVEKRKTGPSYRPIEKFYPYALGQLIRYVARRHSWRSGDTPIFITDEVPLSKKKQALKDAVKTVLAHMVPKGVPYFLHHHLSMSNYGLQVADYCSWAIQRKWELNDERSYSLIASAIKSEFDIFKQGTTIWY